MASSEGEDSAEMEYQISSDELVTPHIPSSRWRRAQRTGVATIVFPLIAAAVHDTTYQATEAAIEDTETLDSEVDTASGNFQSIPKKRPLLNFQKRLLRSQVL